jgi:hypothetical protein
VKKIFMARKADNQHRYFRLTKNHRIQLATGPRKGRVKSASQRKMIRHMVTKENKPDDEERLTTVESVQGHVAKTFALERC